MVRLYVLNTNSKNSLAMSRRSVLLVEETICRKSLTNYITQLYVSRTPCYERKSTSQP